ncbi:hypothetical protein CC1G_01036 [Coprinopsis cinerea okayama7|uniref:gamma-glutamylcyclotransferase n=1 Tax=Coprinopsis cinerea (strain Okayama-7 / 130 / ATCC MYA-4618 / FGSC 9003) TaxID=240176 RepID=A8NEA8_COPC7|nr:hypothetical protein CC1G_01036 [Coprinopsis cinerea okayama7\|eukprot:XP_001832974.2 hypothetical protein CC1G_01036 [Coprinopsis cinerea okayama7\
MESSSVERSRPMYFAYGSNLWLDQMRRRCPDSVLRGVGILRDWKWIITDRGYANIVPSPGDLVYGLVFDLSKSDEDTLDVYENVPIAYEKEYKAVEFGPLDTKSSSALEEVLIYIDHIRVTENKPKHEYIHRINRGIEDGIKHGVPESYFEKYFRSFIPADSANNAP